MDTFKKDECISVEVALDEKKREEFLDLIKKKFKEHGKSKKFLEEAFEKKVQYSMDSIDKVYIGVRSEESVDQLDDHHQNTLFGNKIIKLLRQYMFDAHLCEVCDGCGNLFFESEDERIKVCSGCKAKYYCSERCQRAYWNTKHRQECRVTKLKFIRKVFADLYDEKTKKLNVIHTEDWCLGNVFDKEMVKKLTNKQVDDAYKFAKTMESD
jgi:hypothetical protein